MRKVIQLLLLACLWAITAGCSGKDQNPVGFHLVDEGGHWQVRQAVIQDVLADSCLLISTGAHAGYHLLIGSWQGQEARSLLLFEELPDTLEEDLTGVTLTLRAYSEGTDDSLRISVCRMQTAWNDSTVTWEYPWSRAGGDFEPDPLAQGDYALDSGDELELTFNQSGIDVVAGWLAGQPNQGLILIGTDLAGDNLKYFYSREYLSYDPVLALTFATGDTTDTTISVDANRDAFIAQPEDLSLEGFLCIGDGFVRRTWLQFNLAAIPESAFINRANLSLQVNDFRSPLDAMTVRAHSITNLETMDFNSSVYGSASLSSTKTLLEVDITSLVQKWAWGDQNLGFLLKSNPEYGDLSRALFFSSTADSSQRPTLAVIYTIPPGDILPTRQWNENIP